MNALHRGAVAISQVMPTRGYDLSGDEAGCARHTRLPSINFVLALKTNKEVDEVPPRNDEAMFRTPQISVLKQTLDEHRFFYVDETGDPNFYAKGRKLIVGTDGCSRTFGVGLLRIVQPDLLQQRLSELRTDLCNDRYLRQIPSMKKTATAFHAKDDCPEVREAVF